jgi:hypothetical protein
MPESYMRGATSRSIVQVIRTLPPAIQEQISKRAGPGRLEEAANAGLTEWVPSEKYLVIVGAVSGALDPAAKQKFWHDLSDVHQKNPLFSGIIQFTSKVLKVSPASLIRAIPTAWTLSTKNAGTLIAPPSSREKAGELLWENAPSVLIEHSAYLEVMRGGFLGVFSLSAVSGDCTFHREAPDRARFQFTW